MPYDIAYEIQEHIGILSKNESGWRKELTMTSWKGKTAKLDIRSWNEDYTKHSKQGTFTSEELKVLRDLLNDLKL